MSSPTTTPSARTSVWSGADSAAFPLFSNASLERGDSVVASGTTASLSSAVLHQHPSFGAAGKAGKNPPEPLAPRRRLGGAAERRSEGDEPLELRRSGAFAHGFSRRSHRGALCLLAFAVLMERERR